MQEISRQGHLKRVNDLNAAANDLKLVIPFLGDPVEVRARLVEIATEAKALGVSGEINLTPENETYFVIYIWVYKRLEWFLRWAKTYSDDSARWGQVITESLETLKKLGYELTKKGAIDFTQLYTSQFADCMYDLEMHIRQVTQYYLEHCIDLSHPTQGDGTSVIPNKEDFKMLLAQQGEDIKQVVHGEHEVTRRQMRNITRGQDELLVERTMPPGDRERKRPPTRNPESDRALVDSYRQWEKRNPTVKRNGKKRKFVLEEDPCIAEDNEKLIKAKIRHLNLAIDAVRKK